MNEQLEHNFIKTYGDKHYKHTTLINHRGTVVAFAMDNKRQIYYTVLDVTNEDKNKGPLDVNYWLDNPRLLDFPDEIEQVGYGILNAVTMPVVKKETRTEVDPDTVTSGEIDVFLSTTARLTADVPFQVFSDNQHIYVFRQSIGGNHDDIVNKLTSGDASGTIVDDALYAKDSSGQKIPLVNETLLTDRYILAGTELKLPREVRFRRSENRSRPATAKDSLGAKDMEGNPFYEPTKELDFVSHLKSGCFSVLLLPTDIADIERWQIFAYNKTTKKIDSFNIERGEDGFFNTQGTQLYTSPDEQYKSSVLERKPGRCPFTGEPLVLVDSSAEGSSGVQNTSFAVGTREVESGLAARLYYEQEAVSSAQGAKSVKQNARVLFTAATRGDDHRFPVEDGLLLHLDAESYRNGNQWPDASGFDHHATWASGNMPTKRTASNAQGKNFPYMKFLFSDVENSLNISDTLSLNASFTAIVVDRYSAQFNAMIWESGGTLSSRDNRWLLGKDSGKSSYTANGNLIEGAADATVGEFTITTASYKHRGVQAGFWYVDGVQMGIHNDSYHQVNTPGKLRLAPKGEVDVACVLIWDRYLSESERHLVEKWLGDKYGISVPHAVDLATVLPSRRYVAAIDFGVSQAGKLAQVPKTAPLPIVRLPNLAAIIPPTQKEITTLEGEIPSLSATVTTLETEIATLRQETEQLTQSLNQLLLDIHYYKNEISNRKRMIARQKHAWSEEELDKTEARVAEYEQMLSTKKADPGYQSLMTKTAQLNTNRQTLRVKQSELHAKTERLAELKLTLNGDARQPMPLATVDSQGLTITTGLLDFAYTDAQPHLFDSALGRMTMYFKGVNSQFFSAYYDVGTARAEWSLAVSSNETLRLISTTCESESNETTVTISDGSDSEHCDVTINNTFTGMEEKWRDVPRSTSAFGQVLNGEAGEKVFVGKLKSSLSGAEVTTIELDAGLSQQVFASSLLVVEDRRTSPPQTFNLVASTTKKSGEKQLAIESATPTAAQGAKVYMVRYDYANKASINRTGYTLANGSLQGRVLVGTTTGNVQNGSANLIVDAHGPRWIADAPGQELSFNGKRHYLSSNSSASFTHEGDVTMEAWVKPNRIHGTSSVIHAKSSGSHYALGLQKADLRSALYFDGSGDDVNLGNSKELQITGNQTLEMWIKPKQLSGRQNPYSKAFGGEGTITLESDGTLSYYHGTSGRDSYTYQGVSSQTTISADSWSHVAVVRNLTNKTIKWFINGVETNSVKADFDAAKESTLAAYLGRGYAGYFNGWLDDVRIWNVARSAEEIKTNMNRRLGGREPGLIGYYHFEYHDANDRSGHGHHGALTGNIATAPLELSPLSTNDHEAYRCIAVVDDNAIATNEAVAAWSWQHLSAVFNQSYALRFDGDDYGDAGSESMLNITEDLTIEAFVQLDTLGRKHGILSKGMIDNGSEGTVPYAFYIDESGKLVFAFEGEGGANYRYSSSRSLAANQFYRVAVVRKIGQEKIEKTGTRSITYTDEDDKEQTQTFDTIESIEFKDHSDIRFYIDADEYGHARHNGKKPIGNSSPLYLGRSYVAGQVKAQLQGAISEIRIWNVARGKEEVNSNVDGAERGLAAWWRMEENGGNIAFDAKGGNHARMSGTTWVKTPDPNGSSFVIYRNGQPISTSSITKPSDGGEQFTLGAKKLGASSYGDYLNGEIEEVRVWKTARRHEEILDNMFTRLKGEKADLIANYTFDEITSSSDSDAGRVKDNGLKSNHLTLPTADVHQPTLQFSTAPISNDTAQVRSALSGVKTDFHDQIGGRPAVAEYADAQRLADGTISGIYKRCYAYIQNGRWRLSTGYKVGNLVTEWIGQAQFDPQVVGYIEGAPPVPSENLTEGFYRTTQTFNGTSEVRLNESEEVNYSISTSKEDSFMAGFEAEAEVGIDLDPRVIIAPLGVGMSKKFKFNLQSTLKLGMEANGSWSKGESYGTGQKVTRKMAAAIGGSWDVDDKAKWANPDLTRRFVPANMGFAFVESETADVYALRLEHTGTLVAFRMVPNPDIPKDTNIIPFPINNRYTKQGTLDGRLGYTSAGIAFDPDYANSSGYGEYSYFKPKEAYELKKRVEREEQRLKEFYSNFNTNLAGARHMGTFAGLFGGGIGGALALAAGAASSGVAAPVLSTALLAGGMGTTIGSAIDAGNFDNRLAEKYARRNLVNTYVWTADGGFFEESTQISQVRSTSASGNYKLTGKGTGGFKLEFETGVKYKYTLNGMLGGSLTQTKFKTESAASSFSIGMKLLVPTNLQKYEYQNGLNGGVSPVYDGSGNPVKQPGKVDAFRFMTFYLEPQLSNFEDLFGKVVDPIWLEESNHPNAIALRQANQSSKKPKCWRVFHRVTFVSRILPDFPTDTAPSLEQKMKHLDIASNYELVRRLDPYVHDQTASWTELKEAVEAAVQAYLPELSGEDDLNQIISFMADYYGVVQ